MFSEVMLLTKVIDCMLHFQAPVHKTEWKVIALHFNSFNSDVQKVGENNIIIHLRGL